MIKHKADLLEYLQADAALYPKLCSGFVTKWKNILITNPINTQYVIFRYIVAMRYAEYHENNSLLYCSVSIKSLWHTLLLIWYNRQLRKLSYKTGFQIPPNTCGKGLQIWHYGSIIVNGKAKIGDYATILPGVVVGAKENGVPNIGKNVYLGAGAKILGRVKLLDNVVVAPNAVVVKDVQANCVVAGVPARVIKTIIK